MSPKATAYLLILRWAIAFVFLANGFTKLSDPSFGANADDFFRSLGDDVIFNPYKTVLKDMVIPNAFIFASFVKYSELFLAAVFFFGWPLRLAVMLSTFLHLNYLCIASFPAFMYLNIIMIAAEWAVMTAFDKDA
ncbi:MAG: DoxX family membrane protein [Candidatus Caenarcaniphilales bacterium]|jgi:uncharacterized membrane protein YphA (DoxX/SURF4 family)|nr:DoxX family membrane protein [Candidatus Caenarcaniphilales bacterium]